MKLFTKYNRVNIAAIIFTFVLGSIAFYFVLNYVLIRQLNETLRSEQQEIIKYVTEHQQLPEIENTKHQWITIEKISAPLPKLKTRSIPFYNKQEDETEYIRQLFFSITVAQQNYLVTVNKSETETDDLLKLIILITVGMIGLILLFNYLINRKLVNRLWQPFYKTIDSIKDYQLSNRQPLQLSKEPIDELDLLNDSLNKMTLSIYHDYNALKSFTENASHEMQTPLAVIRSKVEMLLQQPEWKEQSLKQLLSIEDATQKLSKLHQSLLLLTKLENRQFVLNEPINLKNIIENKLQEREELFLSKQLKVTADCKDVTVAFHQHLAEIFINNLLNNAIRYTSAEGEIFITLTNESLSIRNTATTVALDKSKIFQRFYKTDESHDGTGLGLAIIKEICNLAGFGIVYEFSQQQHIFTIHFKT